MELKFKSVCGIDVSKKTFDATVGGINVGSVLAHKEFANTPTGFAKFMRWIKKEGFDFHYTLFCAENTGVYHRALAQFLLENHLCSEDMNVLCLIPCKLIFFLKYVVFSQIIFVHQDHVLYDVIFVRKEISRLTLECKSIHLKNHCTL